MNEQIAQITQMLNLSNHGHILYTYEEIDKYIKNAVSYIKTGIESGDHLIIIDSKTRYDSIFQILQETISADKLACIHHVDNVEFYGAYGDFNYQNILNYFQNIYKPFHDQHLPVRTWAHVEWMEQEEIIHKLVHYELIADQCVSSAGMISVCAYNANRISASLQTQLLRSHEYLMTDRELVKSILYNNNTGGLPFLPVQKDTKKMEGQLKATQHQLKSFIMHNLDPVVILDKDDKYITVNHAFEGIFGWTAAEVLGINAFDSPVVPPDRKFEVSRNRSYVLSGEMIEGYESVRMTKNGTLINVMLSCFPLWDEDDNVNGWAVIIRDITDRKQAQELLIRSEKLSIAGELAASIAHEIRNPVTTIKGFLQLMQPGTAVNANYYDVMSSEIDRIELILSELLMLAKPQVFNFQEKNISLLIHEVIALLVPQANMNNVLIRTEIDSDQVVLRCEENQIKQAFINFIKNAIEAMPKGGELIVQMVSINKNELFVRFIDQGSGIPRHTLTKLGQPFYTTKEKGTGLGFMVSKKIIENHRGSILISSEVNKGTTIEVKLPL